tara:strand:+ start:18218 stop:20323 length:2106 start_codon:yes stop_codon:yes gene_type:complete
MSPRYGIPILVALLLASSWSFTNNDTIELWMTENTISITEEEVPLVPLQENERWLVLLVDFEEQPATDAWGPEQAQTLLDDVAQNYINQLSGGLSEIQIDVHSKITRANGALSDYGSDSNENRDTASDGTFLPMSLAEQTVNDHETLVDWDEYDLDGDGYVDRLLILHSTKGQEENPGQTSNIWSHFTMFDQPILVDGNVKVAHYTMASLRTGSSGMGTILHEMLHQMGALDLYPVHETHQLNDWQGVGDWDIMASGNWNGGGVWPALPTAASLDLLEAGRSQELDLTWPQSAQAPCIGPSIQMQGMSENGTSLKIPLNDMETIWIEYRSNSGFDQHLPGSGILVTYQDRSVGDEEKNELNRDSDQPWLRVIEADGRTDLLSGANSGEAADLFLNNTSFGASGVQIFTHDGFLVPWVATVKINITVEIHFSAPNCTSQFQIDIPDYGGVYLLTDNFPLVVSTTQPCELSHELVLSDGRGFSEQTYTISGLDTEIELQYSSPATENSISIIEGFIHCGEDSLYLKTQILTLGRIPLETDSTGTLAAFEKSTLEVPIFSQGNSSQTFTVELDGPMSRIGSVSNQILLDGTDKAVIEIEPNGLLADRMSVDGELILISQSGHRWTINLAYTAVDGERNFIDELRTPGNLLGGAGIILILWIAIGMVDRKPKTGTNPPVTVSQVMPAENLDVQTDAWGRTFDDTE